MIFWHQKRIIGLCLGSKLGSLYLQSRTIDSFASWNDMKGVNVFAIGMQAIHCWVANNTNTYNSTEFSRPELMSGKMNYSVSRLLLKGCDLKGFLQLKKTQAFAAPLSYWHSGSSLIPWGLTSNLIVPKSRNTLMQALLPYGWFVDTLVPFSERAGLWMLHFDENRTVKCFALSLNASRRLPIEYS